MYLTYVFGLSWIKVRRASVEGVLTSSNIRTNQPSGKTVFRTNPFPEDSGTFIDGFFGGAFHGTSGNGSYRFVRDFGIPTFRVVVQFS
jgi:hypothetical protein